MKNLKRTIFFVGIAGMLFSCMSYKSSFPPLYKAVLDGNIEKVKMLVENGEDINAGAYGYTPLECAAEQGELNILKYLLSKDAQTPQKAYERAVSKKQDDIAKFLLDKGYVDINNSAHLFYSILKDKEVPIEERMMKVKELTDGKLTSPYLLALVESEQYSKVIDFFEINLTDKADALGNSILHVAAKRNNYDLLMYLLENEFDINTLDNRNHTALFYAITVFGAKIDWHNPVIEDESTAHIKFVSDMPYYNDPRSVQQTQVKIVYALLEAGINLDQQDSYGWTVLHFASAAYPEGLQELLIAKGADQSLNTNYGRTAADILALRK